MSKKSDLEHLDAKQLVRNDTTKVPCPRKKKNVCTKPCTTMKKKRIFGAGAIPNGRRTRYH